MFRRPRKPFEDEFAFVEGAELAEAGGAWETAKQAGFRVVGYYFQSNIEDCKRRNEQRTGEQQVPLPGLLGTYSKLAIPSIEEGFDEMFYVRITDYGFVVEEWKHEV